MLTVAAAGMLACTGKDAKYVITGKNVPQNVTKVYLVDRMIEDDIDSATVVNGTFQLKGKADKDAFLGVVMENFEWNFPLINDGVPMVVDFADTTLSGSALNNKITECEFKTYELDGTLKDTEYGKENGEIANKDFYNKAQKAVGACDQYAKALVSSGNIKDVDAIGGATINFGEFKEAVQLALKQAEQ